MPDPTGGALARRKIRFPFVLPAATVSHSDVLFLDTETTGLVRGTGTHVFLVGVGFYHGSEFRVHQYFLRDLHEEPSLLAELEELISSYSVLVSYNGRTFDWPLLQNRFILHGHWNVPELSHWDLLHSARRVWRNRLRDCSLGSIERSILGVQRVGDIPGSMIPDLYFDYLRSRDARPLRPVLSHNEEDIVSLARLAEILLRCDEDPLNELVDPTDRISYGIYRFSSGNDPVGEKLILSALDAATVADDLRFRGCQILSGHYKRNALYDDALRLWNSMLAHRWHEVEQSTYPLIELAKYHEHKRRDNATAVRFVERAMDVASVRETPHLRAEIARRYARLVRKLGGGTSRDTTYLEQVAE